MTRDSFINMLKENLKPDAEINFLLNCELNNGIQLSAFLDIWDAGMSIDVDDPNNKNCGGIVFVIKKELYCK